MSIFMFVHFHWHNGYSLRQWSGRPGFNPMSSHNKNSKNVIRCLLAQFSIIRYGSRVSGVIQGNEWYSPFHLGVVTIEKGTFGLPSTTVGQYIYIYIYISKPSIREGCVNFFSEVYLVGIQIFLSLRLVATPRLKSSVSPTIYRGRTIISFLWEMQTASSRIFELELLCQFSTIVTITRQANIYIYIYIYIYMCVCVCVCVCVCYKIVTGLLIFVMSVP